MSFTRGQIIETPHGSGRLLGLLTPYTGHPMEDIGAVLVGGRPRTIYAKDLPAIHTLADTSKIAMLDKDLPSTITTILPNTLQSIGTDPEIFAFGPKGGLIPAFKYLKAKGDPKGGGVFWDGYQAELTLDYPYQCIEQMCNGIQQKLCKMYSALRTYREGASFQTKDVVEVSRKSLSESDEKFVGLGCSPSLNAYGTEPIMVPDARLLPLRFSGCHSHHAMVDYSANSNPNYAMYNIPQPSWFPEGTVVMMDKIAGLCLTAIGRGLEDPRRRHYYGRPGEYRLPSYNQYRLALEYRTPGAFVLSMPELVHFSTNLCRVGYSMGLLTDGRTFPIEDVKKVITECDADGAWEIINKNRQIFTPIFDKLWDNSGRVFKLLQKGIASSGQYQPDPVKSWYLAGGWPRGNVTTFGNFLSRE